MGDHVVTLVWLATMTLSRSLWASAVLKKEAQYYFYLLKYGPKTPSPLATSLHTHREDVHRTLTALIEKGMVRPSLDSATVYAAVELETALEAALKQHESELREMEHRKRELEELAQQQRFRPSDEVATFKIIKNVKEMVSLALPIAAACHIPRSGAEWSLFLTTTCDSFVLHAYL